MEVKIQFKKQKTKNNTDKFEFCLYYELYLRKKYFRIIIMYICIYAHVFNWRYFIKLRKLCLILLLILEVNS